MSEESLRTSGILLAVFGSPWTVVLRRHPTSSAPRPLAPLGFEAEL